MQPAWVGFGINRVVRPTQAWGDAARLSVRDGDLRPLLAVAGVGPRGHGDLAARRCRPRHPDCEVSVAAVGLRAEHRVARRAFACHLHRGVELLTTAHVQPRARPAVGARAEGHEPSVVLPVRGLELVAVCQIAAIATRLPADAGRTGCGHRSEEQPESCQYNDQHFSSARHGLTSLLPFCLPPDEET